MDNPVISVANARKAFNSLVAVDDVSLEIDRGEVFGIVGPNGAGKTTLIRLIIDIIRPDSGVIKLFGRQLIEKDKSRIGYLPEERGLYLKQKVLGVLEYFGSLKGLKRHEARDRARGLLARFEMMDVADKKIGELSKGNQQKIQLISSMVADPEVLILDEPFSGLDPVNSRMVSELITELAALGKTVLLSTHRMDSVEALCQRVFMMNKGKRVLYGRLAEIKRQHSSKAILVDSDANYDDCELLAHCEPANGMMGVHLRDGVAPREFFGWLLGTGADVRSFEQASESLEDIFVNIVRKSRAEDEPARSSGKQLS